MTPRNAIRPDIVALNAENVSVLAVELKANPISKSDAEKVVGLLLDGAPATIQFGMLIDPEDVRIYTREKGTSEPAAILPTKDLLSFYDPRFLERASREHYFQSGFEDYLSTLVEAWLRDVAYHWKSESPPFIEMLASLGIEAALHEGTTVSQSYAAA